VVAGIGAGIACIHAGRVVNEGRCHVMVLSWLGVAGFFTSRFAYGMP
jgi:hypothetical protein